MTQSSRPLQRDEVDVGLIIHEGQLYYGAKGLHQVLDLGVLWFECTEFFPLPLGGNVVRKDLGPDLVATIARLLKQSIQCVERSPRRRWTTRCVTCATRRWPTNSSACTSTNGPSTTVLAVETRSATLLGQAASAGLVPPVDVQFVG